MLIEVRIIDWICLNVHMLEVGMDEKVMQDQYGAMQNYATRYSLIYFT